jgi:hypothetical protein
MINSMKSENKLDGASNFRAWKTRIDLMLAKNKVLDIVKGKIVKPEFEEGEEKELQNVAAMEKFKDVDINAMSIVIARFVGKVQGLETGVTGASPPTVTSMGGSFYLGGQVQGRRP